MSDPIVERIEREAGVPGLVDVLAERLAPTDLQSLLLAVMRRRTSRLTPAEILRRYEADRFVRPAAVDPARLDELERIAFDELAQFERVELSPVAPLGTCSTLAGHSADRVLATIRGSEVVSDSTNTLALECALRRRHDRKTIVRLCTTQRLLRTQQFPEPFAPHFRLVGLVAGGRSGEEEKLLAEQLGACARIVRAAGAKDVAVDREPRKQRYYAGATFAVSANGLEIVEGGFVDWTQQLLGDRKELLLIAGIGIEQLARATG